MHPNSGPAPSFLFGEIKSTGPSQHQLKGVIWSLPRSWLFVSLAFDHRTWGCPKQGPSAAATHVQGEQQRHWVRPSSVEGEKRHCGALRKPWEKTADFLGFVVQATDVSALGVGANEGDVIKFLSDGASAAGTIAASFTAVMRRGI